MKKQIVEWLDKRDQLLNNDNEKEADKMQDKITKILKEQTKDFDCDFILETITRFGGSPSVIYDDNGMWAVLGDGTQPVVCGDDVFEGTVNMMFFCERNQWFSTIREALVQYLHRHDKD